MKALSEKDLQNYLDEHHIEAKILMMREPTPTVAEAARALKIEEDQVLKSLVFKTPSGPVLVIANGCRRIDYKLLANHLGVGRRKVKFCPSELVAETTGFVVGSMPPFGHIVPMRTLVDTRVTDLDLVYAGGGAVDAMLELTTTTLLKHSQAEILDLSCP